MSYEGWYPALPVPIGAPMYVGGEMGNYVGFNDFQTTGRRSGDNQGSVITTSTNKYGSSSGYRINNSRNPFNWLPYGLTNAFAPASGDGNSSGGSQPQVDGTDLGNDQLCWYPSQTEYSTIDSSIAIGNPPKTASDQQENGAPRSLRWTTDFQRHTLQYTHGHAAIGVTANNHSRWNLLLDEYPRMTDDPQNEPNLQPTLRKFPRFLEAGSALCENQGNGLYMSGIQTKSTVTVNSFVQDNKFIYEGIQHSAEGIIERATLWRNFIEAQSLDGMIDITAGETIGVRQFFYAYCHVAAEVLNDAVTFHSTNGHDTIRERPRGLIICVDLETYLNQSTVYDANGRLYHNSRQVVDLRQAI